MAHMNITQEQYDADIRGAKVSTLRTAAQVVREAEGASILLFLADKMEGEK